MLLLVCRVGHFDVLVEPVVLCLYFVGGGIVQSATGPAAKPD